MKKKDWDNKQKIMSIADMRKIDQVYDKLDDLQVRDLPYAISAIKFDNFEQVKDKFKEDGWTISEYYAPDRSFCGYLIK